jgi:hypothetical protein
VWSGQGDHHRLVHRCPAGGGALPTGEVRRIVVEPTAAFNSHTIRVRLAYSADAPTAADGSRVDYWWPKMRRLIEAYREWDCAALLG